MNELRKLTDTELKRVLHEHAQWIKSEGKSGKRANLSWSDLRGANLSGANLSWSDLRGSNLSGSDLRWSDLRGSNLSGSNLRWSDLSGSDLRGSDLSGSNLSWSDLSGSNLSGSDLSGSDLSGSKGAFVTMMCPSDGAFVGWKKCRGNLIVKLLIPEDARRLSGTGRKCRCDKAKVLEIQTMDGKPTGTTAHSNYCYNFVYTIGETVVPDVFCTDRWQECSGGIHFFITREEAVRY